MKYTLWYVHACSDEYCASSDKEGEFNSLDGAKEAARSFYGGPALDEWGYDDIMECWSTEGDDDRHNYNYYVIYEGPDE